MGLFNLKPSRSGPVGESAGPVVSDLDALIAEPVPFKLHGRVWNIRPVTTIQLFQVMDKLSVLDGLRYQATEVSAKQIVDAYFDLFHQVCPEMTKDDVEEMSQSQCIALLQLIVDSVSGKAQVELEKKKKLEGAQDSSGQPQR